jgi:hypothetical protein
MDSEWSGDDDDIKIVFSSKTIKWKGRTNTVSVESKGAFEGS